MLVPRFKFELGHSVVPGLVSSGRLEDEGMALVVATAPDRVAVYTGLGQGVGEGGRAAGGGGKRELAVNQGVTALGTGRLENGPRDALLIGTSSSLLAYDLQRNADLFFCELPDGVGALACGRVAAIPKPLVLAGGNCSVQGFEATGSESYWTVASDNVTAMCLRSARLSAAGAGGGGAAATPTPTPTPTHPQQLIVVGCEDGEVRALDDQQVVAELSEGAAVTSLVPLDGGWVAYALANGTVGVYGEGFSRLWSHRGKGRAVSLAAFDLDGDGKVELCVAWAGGALEVFSVSDGRVVYRDAADGPLAGAVVADLRGDGAPALVCVSAAGQVRGYQRAVKEASEAGSSAAAAAAAMQSSALADLLARRRDLARELAALQESYSTVKSSGDGGGGGAGTTSAAAGAGAAAAGVPPDTTLSVTASASAKAGSVVLTISTSNETVIKAVVLVADAGVLFPRGGDSQVTHFARPQSRVSVALSPARNQAVELSLRVVVSAPGSEIGHALAVTHRLPPFASFAFSVPRDVPVPESELSFRLPERSQRVALWLRVAFGLDEATVQLLSKNDSLCVAFVDVRNGRPLVMRVSAPGGPSSPRSPRAATVVAAGGQPTVPSVGPDAVACLFRIACHSMELAGEVAQSLLDYLGAEDVESTANFPADLQAAESVLREVEEHNSVRVRLSGDVADSAAEVKELLVRADDARAIGDVAGMMAHYDRLLELNREMAAERAKRATNQQSLLDALRRTNACIQHAARLRHGRPQAAVVAACRDALRTSNTKAFVSVMQTGAATPLTSSAGGGDRS